MASSADNAPLKKTVLNAAHRRINARMVPFGGWDMPVDYGSQLAEHTAVRTDVGMFDVSHMGQARLRGARALELIDLLVPGNIGKLKDGESLYTTLCRPNGGIVDDLIVTRVGPKEVFAVINASTSEKDVAWMQEQAVAAGFGDVLIENESAKWGMIAVQGPRAFEVLAKVLPSFDWAASKSFTLAPSTWNGAAVLISRTGYTGEIGAEVMIAEGSTEALWEALLAAGAKPCGLGARDTLRLEMGYPLYGQDLDDNTSPFEGGIGWTVSLKKAAPFIGRAVLEQHKTAAPRRRVGLKIDSRRPIRHDDKVFVGDVEVGKVTSGGFSPVLQCGIAMALVANTPATQAATTMMIESRGTKLEAKVVSLPFVDNTTLAKK